MVSGSYYLQPPQLATLQGDQCTFLGMREHRRLARTRISASAKIIARHFRHPGDCAVRDISSVGACLELPSTTAIPSIFELTFDGRTCRVCHVVWRTMTELGVEFQILNSAREPSFWDLIRLRHRIAQNCETASATATTANPDRDAQ
jgi:hypothetical protein